MKIVRWRCLISFLCYRHHHHFFIVHGIDSQCMQCNMMILMWDSWYICNMMDTCVYAFSAYLMLFILLFFICFFLSYFMAYWYVDFVVWHVLHFFGNISLVLFYIDLFTGLFSSVSYLHVNWEFNFVHISINLSMNAVISTSYFVFSFLIYFFFCFLSFFGSSTLHCLKTLEFSLIFFLLSCLVLFGSFFILLKKIEWGDSFYLFHSLIFTWCY